MAAAIGAFLLGIAAIATGILAAALRWPWPWWAFGIIAAASMIAGVLMFRREQEKTRTVFMDGDPESLVAIDIFTNAEKFIQGSPRKVFLDRIRHMPFGPWSKN